MDPDCLGPWSPAPQTTKKGMVGGWGKWGSVASSLVLSLSRANPVCYFVLVWIFVFWPEHLFP